ncbi:MAG: holo-[acyl-carrier-protein] synthase [Acidobacteria bacterium RIFCSPLOWO2_12_FULL_54_10]|nr:MAG: holo-[acyl-carrier-protein] synthase [Acidobacteria bacterium RIFCSPLOWO2_12_FULL_54_10]
MILGMGMDIEEIARVREVMERHGERFVKRVFTAGEVSYCSQHKYPELRYAARFAAKEAAMKALGTGWRDGVAWKQIEVANLPSGKPTIHLNGKALEVFQLLEGKSIAVTLSHSQQVAVAAVIIEG